MNTNSNEPAFPVAGAVCNHQFTGMTLRDYFAAKAMQGMMSSSGCSFQFKGTAPDVAAYSYEIADAMLAARSAA